MDGGGGSTTVQNNTPPASPEEQALIALNTQLAQKQLANIDNLAPFQQKLLDQASAGLDRQTQYDTALNAVLSPADQAAATKAQFDRSASLDASQSQLLQMQMDALKSGGKATPDQLKTISDATDASIAAGTGDIDTQTKRGIGLIADELANSRGLRLSDAPIGSEAALLTRAGSDQKASLVNNLRANQANAALNYPLAVQGLQSGINLSQQQVGDAAAQFQAQLRQQAYQNRLSLTGPATSTGLGLAGVGGVGIGALNSLTSARMASGSKTSDTSNSSSFASTLGGVGSLASGIGALSAFSDVRLKRNIERIGTLDSGIGLYEYDIGDRHERGVLAQEVEKVRPDAVATHRSGYKVVDYARLR